MSPDRSDREVVASRLATVGLGTDRYVSCVDGEKKCLDHDTRTDEPPAGNYGVYATPADQLVLLDVDECPPGVGEGGLAALPPTLTVTSPHAEAGEGHRYYRVDITEDGRLPAAVLKDEFDKMNPQPSWGEVRAANQYVVGPGSQLDGCDTEDCTACAEPDGGRYTIAADRAIATIDAMTLVDVLREDPALAPDAEMSDFTDDGTTATPDTSPAPDDADARLELALDRDAKLARLWRGDASDYGGDRSRAECALAQKLGWWMGNDRETVRFLMDRSGAEKWAERTDDAYRESVLEAVGRNTDYYEPTAEGGADDDVSAPDADGLTAEAAAIRLRDLLETYEGDDDDPSEARCEEIGRLTGAITDEVYDDLRDRIERVLGTSSGVLDEHRRLMDHYLEHGPIRVEYGSTFYLTGTPLYKFRILNFELAVTSFLHVPEEPERAAVRVTYGDETFETRLSGDIFKERQRFEDGIAAERLGMTFDTHGKPWGEVLDALNQYIASRDAPVRRGTHHMGLHDGEFVLPEGSLCPDGWTDDPSYVYLDRDLGIERAISLPESTAEYDADDVAQILEELPHTRDVARFLPVLAWFYAAPFRPYIEQWESGFNLLNITGDTGSGKTTTLRYLWRCFGLGGEPFDARDTWFVLLSTFGATNGIPVWHDEYKPSDMTKREVDRFHDALRKTATGSVAQRGNADKSITEYHMQAPSVVSGEQQIQPPAERRRSIMVNFRTAVTEEGTETRRQFKHLVGSGIIEDGDLILPDAAPDPMHHALAYYRFVTGFGEAAVRERWLDARQQVWDIRAAWNDSFTLDDMEIQGLQTVVFGFELLRSFAEHVGADRSALPDTDDLEAALRDVAEAIGPDGGRKSHLDRFIELFERAAAAGYIKEGVDFTVVKHATPEEELRIKVDRAYDKVSKYARDHGLDTEDLLDAEAYKDRFKIAAEEGDGYVVVYGQNTPPLNRCVGISIIGAMNALEFDRMTFDLDPIATPPKPTDSGDKSAKDSDELATDADPEADPESAEYARQKARAVVRNAGRPVSRNHVLVQMGQRYGIPPKVAERGIDKAIRDGSIAPGPDGDLTG